MSDREIVKEYTNGALTVLWKPKKCIHAAECVKRLPNVYNPNEKPWIKAENASVDALKEQIQACPSGALSYREANQTQVIEEAHLETKIEVLENGPLLVYGTLHITNSSGDIEKKNKTTAFCRCGASNNKPYCDGTHNNTGFKG
jgi:uncharacterized Fe-S cluster protein YjdI